MTTRKLTSTVFVYAVLILGAIFSALPFLWMLSTSLKTMDEVNAVPQRILPAQPKWSNYPEAMTRAKSIGVPFMQCYFNSALVAGLVTLGVIVTSVLAGFAFSTFSFAGKNILFMLMLATMMIPFEVILIPNFLIINTLGIYDTLAALILPWIANVFSVFFIRRIFDNMPSEMYDAARVDGCTHTRFLWRIALPMIRPAIVVIALYTFLGSWNAFLWPLIATSDPSTSVIQKALSSFIEEATVNYHLMMAAATLTILPVVLLYLAMQKWFEQGAEQMTT